MNALKIEFYKTRRRKVWLVVAALIATQFLWALWAYKNMDAHELEQGWIFSCYQFPLLNSIMMPVIAAVVASRLADMEHKGQTFRLLETVLPAGQLFDIKFLSGAFYMFAAAALQVLLIVILGYSKGFAGKAPVTMLGVYFFINTAVNLTILLFQQVLSLLFTNQMVAFATGLMGSFFGLFSLFFPQGFQKWAVWGYYGVLMFVRMDWDRATRISDFYWMPLDWSGFVLLVVHFCVIYSVGRFLFVKREF